MRFRLKIDSHDYETKKGHVVRFLEEGDKVKVMIMFRGREQSRPEMGVRLLQKLAEEVSDKAVVESMPKQDGRNMVMVLGPLKKKADAMAEQRKRAAEVNAKRMTKSERKAQAHATEEAVPAETQVVEAAVVTETPAVEAPAAAAAVEAKPAAAPKAAASKPAAAKSAAAPKAAAKPAASKPAASKPAAPKAPAKTGAKAAAAKPAASAASKPRPKASKTPQAD